MKLSKDQKNKLIKKLSNITKYSCPLCSSESWEISDAMFEMREYQDGSLIIGGVRVLPVISLMCGNCGNILFLNALQLGLIEQPIKKEVEEESTGAG